MNRVKLNPYLTFNGNCREAMLFYQESIGGELDIQTIGESPLAEKLPADMKLKVLHASLRREGLVLMGTDMTGEKGLLTGNRVSLLLDCSSETEAREIYERLAREGVPSHPLHISFWGALFGDLTDRFGNQWLLHFDERQHEKKNNEYI